MTERILILGNSAAAIAAVRAIRERGGDRSITMVSNEECTAYSPVLTTHYLSGEIPESELYFCDDGFYLEHGIRCRFGPAAVGLDLGLQRVTLADGNHLDYDKLLIATGASAKRLTGLDPEFADDVHYLRTIEDARRIHEAALGARHVVMMGAGLVSMQVAAAVCRPDLRVTCVVASRQVLSQNIDATCAALLRDHIERSANVTFLFGVNVTAIARTDAGYQVSLDSGEELQADLLVAGKGVSPNMGFAAEAGVAADQGVLVDDRLCTNAANVWAAGDVAQGRNRVSGDRELVANWIDACEQGAVAGAGMAGDEVVFAGSIAENITTMFGLPVASVGINKTREGDGLREVVHVDEPHRVYRRLVLRGDVLVGATLLGDTEDIGPMRAAIAAGWEPWPSPEAVAKGHLKYAARIRAGLRAG